MKIKHLLPLCVAMMAAQAACNSDELQDNPVVPPTEGAATLNESFGSFNVDDPVATSFSGWTEIKTSGTASWRVTGNDKAAEADASKSAADVDLWLLTPAIDLAKAEEKTLTFKSQLMHKRDGSQLRLYVLTKASAEAATEIAAPNVRIAGTQPDDAADTWYESGNVDLSGFSGIVYIGFRYTAAGGADKSTAYRVDDVKFNVSGGSAAGDSTTLLHEDFGTTAVNNPLITAYDGFKRGGVGAAHVEYDNEGGAVSVRTTSPSISNKGEAYYDGASGSCNAMMAATGASFVIKNIASCGATNMQLAFGVNQASDTVSLSYSFDGGTNWTPISYGKTTTLWGRITVTFKVPEGTTCLALKFTAAKTQYGARVDDIVLSTTDATGEAAVCQGGGEPQTPAEEITIAALRALNADQAKEAKVTIPDGKKIVGVVVSDATKGNTVAANLQLVSLDNSAGIMVRCGATPSFALGDKVEVVVSGQSLEFYNKLLQVNGVPVENVTKVGTATVTPVTATIGEMTANFDAYESRLVCVKDVSFTETGSFSGTKGISDATGAMKFYTRSQAEFAQETMPTTPQTITGFTTRYNDDLQLCIRSLDDMVAANPTAPVLAFTSASAISVNVGEALSHTFTVHEANLTGTTAITCTNLPSWITLSGAALSGTAPAEAEKDTIYVTATNGSETATQTLVVTVVKPVAPGDNMVANGSFSADWTSGIPTGWNSDVPDKITITQGKGAFEVSNPTGTTKLFQLIPVTAGKSYKLSFSYKASAKKFRIWSFFLATEASSPVYAKDPNTADDLRTKNDYYPAADGYTTQELTFTVPANQTLFRLEFRYYTATATFGLKDVVLTEQ